MSSELRKLALPAALTVALTAGAAIYEPQLTRAADEMQTQSLQEAGARHHALHHRKVHIHKAIHTARHGAEHHRHKKFQNRATDAEITAHAVAEANREP